MDDKKQYIKTEELCNRLNQLFRIPINSIVLLKLAIEKNNHLSALITKDEVLQIVIITIQKFWAFVLCPYAENNTRAIRWLMYIGAGKRLWLDGAGKRFFMIC